MIKAEILAIGNEVLLGAVQDTNSNYLCRVVAARGGRVQRIAVVRDEIPDIADELTGCLSRRPDLIMTCGGLGPTIDDVTLAGVAGATGRELRLDKKAREFVERRHSELFGENEVRSAEVQEARLKMARLPAGAAMIENPVGTAPAVELETKTSTIVCLPGVPAELKGIVEGPLTGLLDRLFGERSERQIELWVECGDESRLSPLLAECAARHPEVYVKSRAEGYSGRFRILLAASADSPESAEGAVGRALDDLKDRLASAGIEIATSIP